MQVKFKFLTIHLLCFHHSVYLNNKTPYVKNICLLSWDALISSDRYFMFSAANFQSQENDIEP